MTVFTAVDKFTTAFVTFPLEAVGLTPTTAKRTVFDGIIAAQCYA